MCVINASKGKTFILSCQKLWNNASYHFSVCSRTQWIWTVDCSLCNMRQNVVSFVCWYYTEVVNCHKDDYWLLKLKKKTTNKPKQQNVFCICPTLGLNMKLTVGSFFFAQAEQTIPAWSVAVFVLNVEFTHHSLILHFLMAFLYYGLCCPKARKEAGMTLTTQWQPQIYHLVPGFFLK